MLFTEISGRARSLTTTATRLVLLGAVAHGVAELLAFLDRRGLQLRPHHLAHRLHPLRDDVPLLAVPLLDEHRAVALVVPPRVRPRVGGPLTPGPGPPAAA